MAGALILGPVTMNIKSSRVSPQIKHQPILERKSIADRALQSGTGALVTAAPAAIGWGAAAVGEVFAGTTGRIVGGALATLATAAATKFGVQKMPGTSEALTSRIANRAAMVTGLSAALGAIGGGVGVLGAGVGGALLSGRVLDIPESLMVHGPQPASTYKPDGFEDVVLTTSDGIQLNAWLSEGKKDDPVAIFFHSNGTNLEDNTDRLEILRNQGFRVLAPEYRGYGDQEGIPTERGLKKDAQAAYDFAKTLTTPDKITLAGQSLGGGVASNLAAENEHASLILESTFSSLAGASEELMGDWAGMLTRGRYPTANNVANLETPVFVAHAKYDSMVGDEAGKKVAANARNSTFFQADFAGHMDVHRSEGFEEALSGFVSQHNLVSN